MNPPSSPLGPKPLLDVVAVEPLPGFILRLTFENGEVRRFAMANFLARAGGVFVSLRKMALFKQANLANGTVAWPNGADLDPELLYEKSIPETAADVAPEVPDYQEEAEEPEAIGLLSVVQLRRDLPHFGTVVELLDESTVLVEFADSQGETVELLPVPKALLANNHSVARAVPADGNVFLDLGFSPEEAAQFKIDSNQRIARRIGQAKGLLEMPADSEGYPRDTEWENLHEVGLEVWPCYESEAPSKQPVEPEKARSKTCPQAGLLFHSQLRQALERLILLEYAPWNVEARKQLDALQWHLEKVKPSVIASQLAAAWLQTKALLEASLSLEGHPVRLPDTCPFSVEKVQGRNG
ncbi:MAG: DUF2442 domain-containing protein [Proteobacteria bacterium]|nr:DUF2442 domain-containing protein [Pseudomonadota bacterium]